VLGSTAVLQSNTSGCHKMNKESRLYRMSSAVVQAALTCGTELSCIYQRCSILTGHDI